MTLKRRRVPTERPGPAGGKRDENRQKRTLELCEAGLKLFVARGIESVTIDEIVNEAGVAKGSFYRYFDDKADLVEVLLGEMAAKTRAAFSECEAALARASRGGELSQPYQDLALALSRIVFEQPDVVRLYLQESRAPGGGARQPVAALALEVQHRAIGLAESARALGLVKPIEPRVAAIAVVGAVEHLACRVLAGDSPGDVMAIPGALISLILDGMRTR